MAHAPLLVQPSSTITLVLSARPANFQSLSGHSSNGSLLCCPTSHEAYKACLLLFPACKLVPSASPLSMNTPSSPYSAQSRGRQPIFFFEPHHPLRSRWLTLLEAKHQEVRSKPKALRREPRGDKASCMGLAFHVGNGKSRFVPFNTHRELSHPHHGCSVTELVPSAPHANDRDPNPRSHAFTMLQSERLGRAR